MTHMDAHRPTKLVRIQAVRGPWFSLGFHVDLQRYFIDLHILWWIVSIGGDYFDAEVSGQAQVN